ncbi:MAG: tRNA-specific 2-thiouridylase MnmA [Elusimicrobia bacterium ADurb.Bin231]|nr:MAG: tRNA-specific 2-thiouridylase MnmA [Elusimicrobia bacterium ADurb.Bin231]
MAQKSQEKKSKIKKVAVGMSGGVDSSIALLLLKKSGWMPIGISLKFCAWNEKDNFTRENICCSAESFKVSGKICEKLGIPYHIVDVSENFKKKVISYFIKELKNGRTPNPCIICNRYVKFAQLFLWAKKHKIPYVATGHYAGVKKGQDGTYSLIKGKDIEKDQTYSLSFLPEKWLKNIIFPLKNYTKKEVYEIAAKEGYEFFLKQKQSQDLCFIDGKSLPVMLEKGIGLKPGPIKNQGGDILGTHQGTHFFTIGQRKGLNLSGGPYFVTNINKKTNVLAVSNREKDLLNKGALLEPVNIFAGFNGRKITAMTKIRYRHKAVKSEVTRISKNKIQVIFAAPQKAVTPGQFAVFYKQNICLGAGRIISVIKK